MQEAKAFFNENGYVLIANVMTRQHRINFIKEYIQKILLTQPWNHKHPFEVFDPITKRKLDVEEDTELYLKALLRSHVDAQTLNSWKEAYPFHRGFAAPCDPEVFHLYWVWMLRQDPMVYEAFRQLLEIDELLVDINRCSVKLAGEGDDEWLHWDFAFLKKAWRRPTALAGKVAVTNSVFYAVPATHTWEAHEMICMEYTQHYPRASAKDDKFKLDHNKPDPLDLYANCVEIFIPEGCMIIWHPMLLHGVAKSSRTAPMAWGIYLGMMEAVDRPEYAAKLGGHLSEFEDRIQSYKEGRAPKLWPSLDPIHYYPKQFVSCYNCLDKYVAKTNPGDPWLTTRRTLEGKEVPHYVPVLNPNYVPPPLTEHGKRLLGALPYPSNKRQRFD